MQVGSSSASLLSAGGIWAQVQQQQAQRTADQAEQRAQALQARAREAQTEADRAQEGARSLKVQSEQAQGEAVSARQGLEAMSALGEVEGNLDGLRSQIAKVLALPAGGEPLVPVVNTSGQQTGTLVSVTA